MKEKIKACYVNKCSVSSFTPKITQAKDAVFNFKMSKLFVYRQKNLILAVKPILIGIENLEIIK